MGLTGIFGGKRGRLLKTGQTTSYSSELDDGHYEKGLAKKYQVKTTGDQSGTSNIDLIHLTDTSIAFAATTPGTITDSNNGLAIFKTGDVIVISGSASNDGVYTVSTGNVAGTIRTTEATLLEAAGASVSIAKREALSNNCVLDLNTGLMWARYTSAENAAMGAASDGKMPWTGELYDIFAWAAAANAASLGGYADWRVANLREICSISDFASGSTPDATTFPGWHTSNPYVCSSTAGAGHHQSVIFLSYRLSVTTTGDAVASYAALVRGGV